MFGLGMGINAWLYMFGGHVEKARVSYGKVDYK